MDMGRCEWLCWLRREDVLVESSDGWLVAWARYACALIRSSTPWFLPQVKGFTPL